MGDRSELLPDNMPFAPKVREVRLTPPLDLGGGVSRDSVLLRNDL